MALNYSNALIALTYWHQNIRYFYYWHVRGCFAYTYVFKDIFKLSYFTKLCTYRYTYLYLYEMFRFLFCVMFNISVLRQRRCFTYSNEPRLFSSIIIDINDWVNTSYSSNHFTFVYVSRWNKITTISFISYQTHAFHRILRRYTNEIIEKARPKIR